MNPIIEDYKRENFTAKEWVIGTIVTIVFTILTAIA